MFKTINSIFGILTPLQPIAGWFIRLSWGATFLYHGTGKFINGIEGFGTGLSEVFGELGLPIAVLVAVAEILAGAGAIVGGFRKDDFGNAVTRLAGLAAFPVMIGAIVLVRWGGAWNDMEFDVLLLAIAIYFMIRGSDV